MLARAFRDIWTADADSESSNERWDRVLQGVERELRAMQAEIAAEAERAKLCERCTEPKYNSE